MFKMTTPKDTFEYFTIHHSVPPPTKNSPLLYIFKTHHDYCCIMTLISKFLLTFTNLNVSYQFDEYWVLRAAWWCAVDFYCGSIKFLMVSHNETKRRKIETNIYWNSVGQNVLASVAPTFNNMPRHEKLCYRMNTFKFVVIEIKGILFQKSIKSLNIIISSHIWMGEGGGLWVRMFLLSYAFHKIISLLRENDFDWMRKMQMLLSFEREFELIYVLGGLRLGWIGMGNYLGII